MSSHLHVVPSPERQCILEMTVPGEPVPWQRAGRNVGRSFTPMKVLNHQNVVQLMAFAAGIRTMTRLPVILDTDFFMGNKRKVDLDNLVKCVMDALNGRVYVDDSQIVALFAAKLVDRETPRTEVRVWTVDV